MSATPEAELRAEIAAVLDLWPRMGLALGEDSGVLVDALLPLFAARAAAIEADNHYLLHDVRTATRRAQIYAERIDKAEAESFEHKEARAELNERCTQYRERADRAEAELAAMTGYRDHLNGMVRNLSGYAEICKIWHDLYGACELPYRHAGPHSRIPGGATEANMWWGTTCGCEACGPERAKLAEVSAGTTPAAAERMSPEAHRAARAGAASSTGWIGPAGSTPGAQDGQGARWVDLRDLVAVRVGDLFHDPAEVVLVFLGDLTPTTRQVLADLANDAQDMGTYGGTAHVCPYGCECPDHNPAGDNDRGAGQP